MGKSFEPENSALDKTTDRRARAWQVKIGLAHRTKKDNAHSSVQFF